MADKEMGAVSGPAEVRVRIAGYRQLSQAEQDLINELKALGQKIGGHVSMVRSHLRTQEAHAEAADGSPEEADRIRAAEPQRWASIARTHFQEGLMALVRAVAQPNDSL